MSRMFAADTACILVPDEDTTVDHDECPLKVSVLMPALARSSFIYRLIDADVTGL